MESKHGRQGLFMRGSGLVGSRMGRGHRAVYIRGKYTGESGLMVRSTVGGHRGGHQVKFMKENGLQVGSTAKEKKHHPLASFTKESGLAAT